jgi:hypothetical protein
LGRGQLDDPRPADAVSRNGEPAVRFHHGREFQLYAGRRIPENVAMTVSIVTITMVVVFCLGAIFAAVIVAVTGSDGDGSREVCTEHGHQEELAFRVNVGLFGQTVAQVSFW